MTDNWGHLRVPLFVGEVRGSECAAGVLGRHADKLLPVLGLIGGTDAIDRGQAVRSVWQCHQQDLGVLPDGCVGGRIHPTAVRIEHGNGAPIQGLAGGVGDLGGTHGVLAAAIAIDEEFAGADALLQERKHGRFVLLYGHRRSETVLEQIAEVAGFVEMGADFIALETAVWDDPRGPDAAVAGVDRFLARGRAGA